MMLDFRASHYHPSVIGIHDRGCSGSREVLDESVESEVAKGEHVYGSVVLCILLQSFRWQVPKCPWGLEDIFTTQQFLE